ncbi:MAG: ATP synthase F1 subunit epsilon [Actinobacteria bacterium]|nr:ATP synthase F1 subunit epsilon [Actinomycetota bacterium]
MIAQVVSPERVLYKGDAEMVVCRTSDGEIAFLPGHVPFVGALGIAKVRILVPGPEEVAAAVHGGFVEVAHDRVTVLSDVAELADQVDVVRARTARDAAADRLRHDPENTEVAEALARAELRLEVAGAATSSAATY